MIILLVCGISFILAFSEALGGEKGVRGDPETVAEAQAMVKTMAVRRYSLN